MSLEPPCPVSATEYVMKVKDIEPNLRPLESPILKEKPYSPKTITMKDGSKMVVRQAKLEEAPTVLKAVKPYMDVEKDFYDIVAVRTYGEILAWYRHRIKDHYLLLGLINGELVGLVNARLWNKDIAISLHTMAFKRGLGVGPALYFSKVEYAFDTLGVKEWWATFESYIGITHFSWNWGKKQKPWPEYQHELGGARVFYLTKEDWELFAKKRFPYFIGERPVPKDLLEQAEKFKIPEKVEV